MFFLNVDEKLEANDSFTVVGDRSLGQFSQPCEYCLLLIGQAEGGVVGIAHPRCLPNKSWQSKCNCTAHHPNPPVMSTCLDLLFRDHVRRRHRSYLFKTFTAFTYVTGRVTGGLLAGEVCSSCKKGKYCHRCSSQLLSVITGGIGPVRLVGSSPGV